MRCLVFVLAVAACARAAAAASASCALAEEYFSRHNISADDSSEPGPICGGQCCGRGREDMLLRKLKRQAESHASATTTPVAELLLSTRRTLQEHLTALSHQSQNKTAVLFTQVYRGYATRPHASLALLYDDIRTLLRSQPERDVARGEDLGSPPPRDLAASTRKFFRDVFPVAYQNLLKLNASLIPEYEACLKDAYDAVQPFGEVPQQLGITLTKSLEAARVLLQVLAVGAGALAASEQVLASANEMCSNKLLRVGACARCRGHDSKPCRSYCLNVARGCMGSLVAELDAPWAGYVEGVERLARPDADAALRALDARVSEAIMHALENQLILEKKVRQECGPPSTVNSPGLSPPRPTAGTARRDALRAPPPDTELLQFAASLAASKKLFSSIADRMCEEPDFAHESNENCWNGDSIGEYTKPLVASASLSDQKYNPEIPGGAPQDSRVATLGDTLRQARQLLVSHSWAAGAPAAEAFMQGDEAGEEGSGSGRSYPEDDASFDAEGSGEEGSGMQDLGSRPNVDEETTYSSIPKTAAATTSQPILSLVLSITMLASLSHCLT